MMKLTHFTCGFFLMAVSMLSGETALKPHADLTVSKNTPEVVAEATHVLRVSARGDHAHKIYLVFDLNEISAQTLARLEAVKLSLTTLQTNYVLGDVGREVTFSLYGVSSNDSNPSLHNLTWVNAPANLDWDSNGLKPDESELLASDPVDSSDLNGEDVLVWEDRRLTQYIQAVGGRRGAKYVTLIVVSEGAVGDPGVNFYSNMGTSMEAREPRLILLP
jgi:hypothetical protein